MSTIKSALPDEARRTLETASKKLGTKKVILIGYTPKVARQRRKLAGQLKKAGFCVCYSGEFGDFLSQWHTNWTTRSDIQQPLKRFARKCLADAIYFMRRSKLLGKLNYASDTENAIYLLCDYEITQNGPGNYYSFFEDFQAAMDSRGLRDRLLCYDSAKREVRQLRKPILGYFEYDVLRHCNLNCKGCSHYSNLYPEPLFGDLAQFKKNLSRMNELFLGVRTIHLLGGEPILHPQLPDFVRATRDAFPSANVFITTNGLLIPKAGAELFQVMREAGAAFNISNYLPTSRMWQAIEKRLKEENVVYYLSPLIEEFAAELSPEEEDARHNFGRCTNRMFCHLMDAEGRISSCGKPLTELAIQRFRPTRLNVSEQDYVDIYRAKDGFEVLAHFHSVLPFCRYCNPDERTSFPWKENYTEGFIYRTSDEG